MTWKNTAKTNTGSEYITNTIPILIVSIQLFAFSALMMPMGMPIKTSSTSAQNPSSIEIGTPFFRMSQTGRFGYSKESPKSNLNRPVKKCQYCTNKGSSSPYVG